MSYQALIYQSASMIDAQMLHAECHSDKYIVYEVKLMLTTNDGNLALKI